jgi:hypothetical protein
LAKDAERSTSNRPKLASVACGATDDPNWYASAQNSSASCSTAARVMYKA